MRGAHGLVRPSWGPASGVFVSGRAKLGRNPHLGDIRGTTANDVQLYHIDSLAYKANDAI